MGKHSSDEVRHRLIDMVYGKSFDLKVAAAALDMKYKTAHKICSLFEKEDRIKKRSPSGRPKVYRSECKNEIVRFFTEKPDATLADFRKHLINNSPETARAASLSTINRVLKAAKISYKSISLVPAQRNSEETIRLR